MAKTIGGDGPSKDKKCAHCGDQFGWTEFSGFFMKLRGNTLRCIVCTEENYLVSDINAMYYIVAAISLVAGIFTFLLINFAVAVGTYDDYDGSFKISFLAVAGGMFLGAGVCRFILRLYDWKTGFFSTDRSDKSIADYE